MKKIVLIDGNSILNRAFYGIMGNKMLTTPDGKYTNAVYGFLAILFKVLEDIEPEYLMVTFDLKAPTARHKLYDGYKATRKGMPNELAEQMPILKDILKSMNIKVIEKEGYEADDVLGTMAKRAEKDGFDVTIVSGDRDTFQLTSNRVKVRIPHTKMGKTETETFGREEVLKKYGVTPKQLIEVKGLQGDTSDNIPGVPGIGEKTALELVKKYKTIDGIYEAIEKGEDDLKPKAKERLLENKELAMLSRTLGTINLEVPIEENLEEFKIKEWNKEEVFSKFKELNFNRFIDRFNLKSEEGPKQNLAELFEIKTLNTQNEIKDLLEKIQNKLVFMLGTEKVEQENLIIKKQIKSIYIYIDNTVYEIKFNTNEEFISYFKTIFENENIQKYSYRLNETYVLLMQNGIYLKEIKFDTEIAAYLLNPSNGKYKLDELANQYLSIDIPEYLEFVGAKQQKETQMTLFSQDEMNVDFEKYQNAIYMYTIAKLAEIMNKKLEEINSLKLFENIEMPLIKVLAEMQYEGIYVDKQELVSFGVKLKEDIEVIKQEIYKLAGEEFNINSTLQLGNILFEKLKLPVYKKTKKGYSTDVDILEKLKPEHPIIEKILEYRGFMKLNSTYIEGLIVYINEYTHKIHSYFHQTITATGRISSTEPNLQNIPTRAEQGKQIKKAFKAQEGNIFIDADYSQIELRILAHISNDTNMREAFLNEEDIHKQVASKVFNVPLEEVTKEQRTAAKAVNFGIVYGISGFGLAEQLGISRKKAEQYIEQYLEKYKGVKEFMDRIVEKAKEQGYVETLFHRRRYIPELSSNNYMVRQFGARAAMNTPIQGTAADIMKIAMIEVNKKLEEEKLNAKLILQIHDELLIECKIEEKEEVKKILKESMENAVKLSIPLEVEVSEADNWYDVK
ncbi:dNA polymerase [Clostridium sp. CAG:508]|jgi:DNA polymerase-1|nr:dNA polymerase [Clostridium sp. CAG:508]